MAQKSGNQATFKERKKRDWKEVNKEEEELGERMSVPCSVTRFGDFSNFGQIFKTFGNN